MKFYKRIVQLANRVAHRIHYTAPNWEWHKLNSNETDDRIEMVTSAGVLHRGSTKKFVDGETSANCSKDGSLFSGRPLIGCYLSQSDLDKELVDVATWNPRLKIEVYYILVWNKLSHQCRFCKSGGRGCGGASHWSIAQGVALGGHSLAATRPQYDMDNITWWCGRITEYSVVVHILS